MEEQENSAHIKQDNAEPPLSEREVEPQEKNVGNAVTLSHDTLTVDFPLADTISVSTLVNLLLQKGILSVDELLEEESRTLQWQHETTKDAAKNKFHILPTIKWRWLQRLMCKRHWSRVLGTRIFGWRWKKVRVASNR